MFGEYSERATNILYCSCPVKVTHKNVGGYASAPVPPMGSAYIGATDQLHYRREAEPLPYFAMAEKTPSKTPEARQWMEGANGGKLQRGNPGNRGGTGRPRSELRSAMRQGLDAALPRLLEAIENPAIPTRDLIAAVNVLARYGIDSKDEEADEGVELVVRVVHAEIPDHRVRAQTRDLD